VIRDVAGLDSIFQAAGRCNRHGEFNETKNVYVVNIANENLNMLPDIKIGAGITRRLFDDNNVDINEYYKLYFYARRNDMDYYMKNGGTMYDLLTDNAEGCESYVSKGNVNEIELRSAIRSASDEFFVIAPGQTSLIVPYGESGALVDEYIKTNDIVQKNRLIRRLGRYSVALYKYHIDSLDKAGALDYQDGLTILLPGFYDKDIGANLDGNPEFLNI
jgi:CRISPR-associated endonuclease/helicase Cas3